MYNVQWECVCVGKSEKNCDVYTKTISHALFTKASFTL